MINLAKYNDAMVVANRIHREMDKKQWLVYGSRPEDTSDDQYSNHLFSKKNTLKKVTKDNILRLLKALFDNNSY